MTLVKSQQYASSPVYMSPKPLMHKKEKIEEELIFSSAKTGNYFDYVHISWITPKRSFNATPSESHSISFVFLWRIIQGMMTT